MLTTIKCKRCGKEISTLTKPLHSSTKTMNKWRGICQNCITEKEMALMMLDMNDDVKKAFVTK